MEPLRILCTEILPWRLLKDQAEADLGFPIEFMEQDFVSAQRTAAMAPDSYDVYDQCFHNLDIVWHWRAIQPIDTARIDTWNEMSDLARSAGVGGSGGGLGDAPATRLYVQPDATLSASPTGRISMLPTVYNFDSFAINQGTAPLDVDRDVTSWAELLDPRWHGRVALVDEPAIGAFDLTMALVAAGRMEVGDLGNMTVAEIDEMYHHAVELVNSGHLAPFWRRASEPVERFASGELSIASIWSPAVVAMKARGLNVRQASPAEGYRAWHGGLCLARHLEGRRLDMAYAWFNWFLDGWAGACMARQGYYMSVPDRVRAFLDPEEWDYWYEGKPAACELPDPDGRCAIRAGEVRSGGSYRARSKHIAVWNSTMDEHNFLVRRWNEIIALSEGRRNRRRAG
ncbi:putative spermidine/putrescine transport system substrate-binding protein [Salinihabitans flavidus]|uniref:Putative spermidine/putrescine transport system substrate-binding protein n=1 Tax=Salinihabitans flavidus TaxID=569882 RepID=A0A1H8P9F3_9RHOB|nr:extracellular solute-binding protein [Salinihabitans flavidus]SEO38374.1 putative spermidine/putrescine transport system substrate-binding protein [Salinihabitans flavidus]